MGSAVTPPGVTPQLPLAPARNGARYKNGIPTMDLEELLTDEEMEQVEKAEEQAEREKAQREKEERRADTKYGGGIGDSL